MKKRKINKIGLVLLMTLITVQTFSQWNQPQWVVDKYEPYTYNFVYGGTNQALAYRLLRPINFDSSKQYPVVITLHGASGFSTPGARDYNIKSLRAINGQFAGDSIRLAHPTYIIALQADKSDMWCKKHLEGAKQIIATLPHVDINKIYVMGQSAGGFGSNNFISYDPNYFAAAIVASAEGNKISVANRDKLVNFNLWTLHGDKDSTSLYSADVELFTYMKAKNARMKFTTFINVGHSTENFIVGSYGLSGGFTNTSTDSITGIVTVKKYTYKTEYAGTDSDTEPNTLDWLFSKSKTNPLSVKFTETFKAYRVQDGIKVDWGTESEINCDHFEIERSSNGVDFERIAYEKGQNNSSTSYSYSIYDEQPFVGTNYYRIKEIDKDGKYTYSSVVSAEFEKFEFKLSPNPVSNQIHIESSKAIEKIEIINTAGQIVRTFLGAQRTLEVGAFSKGIYFLKTYSKDNQFRIQKFSKL